MTPDDRQAAAVPIGDVLRARIREERKRMGWAQGDLAARVTALGVRIHQTTVSKIEEGTRRVTLEELVAIGAALTTPLPMLLASRDDGGDVAVTPEVLVRPWHAVEWLIGARPLPDDDEGRWREQTRPLRRHDDVRAAEGKASAALVLRTSYEQVGDTEAVREAQRRYVEALQELVDALATVEASGYPTSDLASGRFLDDARKLGLQPRAKWSLPGGSHLANGDDVNEAIGRSGVDRRPDVEQS